MINRGARDGRTTHWSHEEVTMLHRMVAAGANDAAISAALTERSIHSVKKKRCLLGLRRVEHSVIKRHSEETVETIRGLYYGGLTNEEIGQRVGLTASSVTQLIARRKFPLRRDIGVDQRLFDGNLADRMPLPAGSPETWGAITRGTVLDGVEYPR